MVYNGIGDLAREMVGSDRDWPSRRAISGTPFADGFDVLGDIGSILGRPATLALTSSAAATGAALLASWVSTWRCHSRLMSNWWG